MKSNRWQKALCLALAPLAASLAVQHAGRAQATHQPAGRDSRPGYVGDAACVTCHAADSRSYEHTAHRLASQPASAQSILGSFRPGQNTLTISDPAVDPELPSLRFTMDKTADGFRETALTGWGTELQRRSESIDVVTGSGARGQTYLFWQGDKLFELPVSYWADGRQWVNSPGYIDGTVDFSRPVNPGCLECHATYIRATSNEATTNSYVKDSLVTGIACETCHGAGAEHVAKYAHAAPHAPPLEDKAILNPARFSRDLQVDACAMCHSGIQRRALLPAFSFTPGKPLKDFFEPLPAAAAEHPDVHGNQVGLLQRSRCFKESPTLSCSACHDVHAAEKPAESYSAKCLTCHQWQSCGVAKTMGVAITKNCIDCHMPIEPTNVIVSETAGKSVRATMRNHWIKVYPSANSARPAGL